jgi:hypothetical protein
MTTTPTRRRNRVLLPGWWRFWEPGPQWSPTARRRIGVPTPQPAPLGDWHLWEAELRPAPPPASITAADPSVRG